MNAFAFVNYARFLEQDGTPTIYAYQNFSINDQRIYSGVTYEFAPFAYTLGAGSRGGDRSDSSLVAGLDQLTVNLFAESVESRWLLEIKTVSLVPVNFADDVLVRTELWRIAQYEMDTEKIILKLSSPLDAAKANIPRRRLTTGLVGALPTTGSLVIS
jgi:hypothetical protein